MVQKTEKLGRKKRGQSVEETDRAKGKKTVVKNRIKKTFHSKSSLETVKELKGIVHGINPNTPCPTNTLNSLIDFTQILHQFRKSNKRDLDFIALHMGHLSKGPVGECIHILNGKYQDVTVHFDSKNFREKAFEKGITITNGQTYSISELRKSDNSVIIDRVRGYMLRTTTLLDLMKSH